jgi:ATP-dependent Clp protease adaptor protein ClpS
MPKVADDTIVRDANGTGLSGICQVVLHNDNINTFTHVIDSLIAIFGHSHSVAEKITREAHTKGKAIAEVEDYEQAVAHKGLLASQGLMAEVEQI